ncbi:TlpA disulfide reductase family protein [Ideonella sp. DXS29W]|uniref:TlpA disulfide reductase family protein n=1 Tax=Ideonella lacteola TaxID=2984193 RepID=A0ABU9BSM0_9BURK
MLIKTLHTLAAALLLSALAHGAPSDAATAGTPPTLNGRTSVGEAVDLASWRGQVVLVYLWSTDCPVCLDRLPELRRNLAGWKGRPFVVLAVNQDARDTDFRAYEKSLDAVMPPSAQMKLVWRRDPAHRDNLGELPLRSPTTLLINRRGELVKEIRGSWSPEIWDDIAEQVLN